MTAPSFACAPHAGHAPYSGLGGRPDIRANVPDVHVVPLADLVTHAVPGDYPDEHPMDVAASGLPWLAIEADPDEPRTVCSCFPSVRPSRHGDTVARLVVHHAADMRPSGQEPG